MSVLAAYKFRRARLEILSRGVEAASRLTTISKIKLDAREQWEFSGILQEDFLGGAACKADSSEAAPTI
jgi:hypothetical protein